MSDHPDNYVNKVDGFDPYDFLEQYQSVNPTTGEVTNRLHLPVRIQILWFRMLYKDGKISVIPTAATTPDGKPGYFAHARIYKQCNDPKENFLAEAVAFRSSKESAPGISPLEWAQTAAIGIALRNVGFGLESELCGEIPQKDCSEDQNSGMGVSFGEDAYLSAMSSTPEVAYMPPAQTVQPGVAAQQGAGVYMPPAQTVQPDMTAQQGAGVYMPPAQAVQTGMSVQQGAVPYTPPAQAVQTGMSVQQGAGVYMPPAQAVQTGMSVQQGADVYMPPAQTVQTGMSVQQGAGVYTPPAHTVQPDMTAQQGAGVYMPPAQTVQPGMSVQQGAVPYMPPAQTVQPGAVNQQGAGVYTPPAQTVQPGMTVQQSAGAYVAPAQLSAAAQQMPDANLRFAEYLDPDHKDSELRKACAMVFHGNGINNGKTLDEIAMQDPNLLGFFVRKLPTEPIGKAAQYILNAANAVSIARNG